jgi:hypothetical protein
LIDDSGEQASIRKVATHRSQQTNALITDRHFPSCFGEQVMKNTRVSFTAFVAIATVTLVVGCSEEKKPADKPAPASTTQSNANKAAPMHAAHGAGPHEGAVADWGGGKYHVEFTVDHGKKEATVYVLGSDEKTASPIKAEKLLLSISEPKFQVDLVAKPLEGEENGSSSRFVGTDDRLGKVQEFSGSISGEVDGTPYVGDFKEEPHGAHEHK